MFPEATEARLHQVDIPTQSIGVSCQQLPTNPVIHFGLVASGDTVMRSLLLETVSSGGHVCKLVK
jgi:hypothetical protein